MRVPDRGILKKLSAAADHYVMARGPQGWNRRASRADRISPSRLKKVSWSHRSLALPSTFHLPLSLLLPVPLLLRRPFVPAAAIRAVIIDKFRFCLARVPWNYKVRWRRRRWQRWQNRPPSLTLKCVPLLPQKKVLRSSSLSGHDPCFRATWFAILKQTANFQRNPIWKRYSVDTDTGLFQDQFELWI